MVLLEAGPFGLSRLPDNSLVRGDAYMARYGRGSEAAPKLEVRDDRRTETERDRGRVAYAPSLRRLAGVTQVVSPDLVSSELHSRATHSYKVAMVAREIAEHLTRVVLEDGSQAKEYAAIIHDRGGLDIAACEAAGLAHDIGHAPFGHAGEEALDALMSQTAGSEGFEGNAQSFRIVTVLERSKVNKTARGLDLTNVTLAAVLKYPWTRQEPYSKPENRKFGAYESEKDELLRVRSALGFEPDDRRQSLEASIMDLADDLAYAVHDLEDFLAAGVIDPRNVGSDLTDAIKGVQQTHDFRQSNSTGDPFTAETERLRLKYAGYFDDDVYLQALKAARTLMTDVPADWDDPIAHISLRTHLAQLVKEAFASLQLSAEPPYEDGPLVHLDQTQWHLIQVLKTITRKFLVNRSPMGALQRSQEQITRMLFENMASWLGGGPKEHHLPVTLRRVLKAANVELPQGAALNEVHRRAIADYICTMSDSEAALKARIVAGLEVPATAALGIHP